VINFANSMFPELGVALKFHETMKLSQTFPITDF